MYSTPSSMSSVGSSELEFSTAQESRALDQSWLNENLERQFDYLRDIVDRDLRRDVRRKVSPSDVVQETMLDVIRSISSYRGSTSRQFAAWVRQILVHNITDMVRQHCQADKRNLNRECDLRVDRIAACISDPQPTPATDLYLREQQQELTKAVENLPVHYRELVTMRNFELLTFAEIAKRTQRSEDAVRKQWKRAISQLSRHFADPHEPERELSRPRRPSAKS
ncbi:MAG: sigma-70 family RNA polymerase sigma factor [Pirellulales bacterium]